jgi:FdhD protein
MTSQRRQASIATRESAALETASTQSRPVVVRGIDGNAEAMRDDLVAREEPLEIQVGPASLAVVMRTPGHDEELALGFMVTERIVASARDVVSIRHCTSAASPDAEDNVIRVILAPHVDVDLAALRRNLYASSSCGICGKATIENVLATAPPLEDDSMFRTATIRAYAGQLRSSQSVFDATGGLHGAGLFDPSGTLVAAREDVGRHNAVDKVIGWAAGRERLPLSGHALMVSGRISYEIVQKAAAARIPLIAAVSAPTSLAVELATALRMTLVGFLRGDKMNVYANQERVRA